jgi:competence protein ComEA
MSAQLLSRARLLAAWARRTLAASAWFPLVTRGAAYLLLFALLALVGSGRMARWMSPPPAFGIPVAEAAPLPPTPASVATTAADPSPVAEVSPALGGPADGGAPGDAGAGTGSNGVAPDGKVILNLANEEDLRRLPGIGRGRAQAILALRGRMKKFTRVEDLLKVKGIGRRGLARIRPLVRVD